MSILTKIISSGNWWPNIINYEIVKGNALWRFAIVLLVMLAAIAMGRICQFSIIRYANRREEKHGAAAVTIFLKSVSKPVSVALFAFGLFVCELFLVFGQDAIDPQIGAYWKKIAQAVSAIAIAYAMYKLVDVFEYYILLWSSKTKTRLDDMLVPVIRKSLRVTIAIIATLWIADGILQAQIRTILLSAGVGGIAIALAARETVANFFGAITIFADRPFQVDELVRIGEHFGVVEDVGFRSTRVRTLDGHLLSIPNSVVVSSTVDNLARRPFIRRTANITITYDSGHTKTKKTVEIIKKILADVPEINTDPEKSPKVYFSDFNDSSLNIYMSYWVKPPDYWLYQQINERVNFEIMKQFEAEHIDFAFPSRTIYVKKG